MLYGMHFVVVVFVLLAITLLYFLYILNFLNCFGFSYLHINIALRTKLNVLNELRNSFVCECACCCCVVAVAMNEREELKPDDAGCAFYKQRQPSSAQLSAARSQSTRERAGSRFVERARASREGG